MAAFESTPHDRIPHPDGDFTHLRRKGLQVVDDKGTPLEGVSLYASRRAGNPVVFPTKPGATLICPFCTDIYLDPVTFPCGHTFCKPCVVSPAGGTVLCPTCAHSCNDNELIEDEVRREQLKEVKIFCKWSVKRKQDGEALAIALDGCREQVQASERRRHEDVCEYKLIPCGLVDDANPDAPVACPVTVRARVADHHRKTCPYRKQRCRRCRANVVVRSQVLHDHSCLKRDCPRKCGMVLDVHAVKRHLDYDCPEQVVQCPATDLPDPTITESERRMVDFRVNRCHYTGKRSELKMHSRTCEYRTTECEFCRCRLTVKSAASHMLRCLEATVPCPNCSSVIKRGDLSKHMHSECPGSTVWCEYKDLGCNQRLLRGEQTDHNRDNANGHIALMISNMGLLKKEVERLGKGLKDLQEEVINNKAIIEDQFRVNEDEFKHHEARYDQESVRIHAEIDSTRKDLEKGMAKFRKEFLGYRDEDSQQRLALYGEFHRTRRNADDAVHMRFNELRAFRMELDEMRLKYQEEIDETRDGTRDSMFNQTMELKEMRSALREEIEKMRSFQDDDHWQHSTKISSLGQQVEGVMRALHGLLASTTQEALWPERRSQLMSSLAAFGAQSELREMRQSSKGAGGGGKLTGHAHGTTRSHLHHAPPLEGKADAGGGSGAGTPTGRAVVGRTPLGGRDESMGKEAGRVRALSSQGSQGALSKQGSHGALSRQGSLRQGSPSAKGNSRETSGLKAEASAPADVGRGGPREAAPPGDDEDSPRPGSFIRVPSHQAANRSASPTPDPLGMPPIGGAAGGGYGGYGASAGAGGGYSGYGAGAGAGAGGGYGGYGAGAGAGAGAMYGGYGVGGGVPGGGPASYGVGAGAGYGGGAAGDGRRFNLPPGHSQLPRLAGNAASSSGIYQPPT